MKAHLMGKRDTRHKVSSQYEAIYSFSFIRPVQRNMS